MCTKIKSPIHRKTTVLGWFTFSWSKELNKQEGAANRVSNDNHNIQCECFANVGALCLHIHLHYWIRWFFVLYCNIFELLFSILYCVIVDQIEIVSHICCCFACLFHCLPVRLVLLVCDIYVCLCVGQCTLQLTLAHTKARRRTYLYESMQIKSNTFIQ